MPSSSIIPIILLTGPPGVGKSTIIRQVVGRLGSRSGGFFTQEVRVDGQRTGFEVVTLSGQTAVLATRDPAPAFAREAALGRYRVNLAAIDELVIPALQTALAQEQIIVVDEIGPMELFSAPFYELVLQLLDSHVPITGTIVQRPHPLADRVKAHPRVRLWPVTLENRDGLGEELWAALATSGVESGGSAGV
jgi:nucleoside-triphosphatase